MIFKEMATSLESTELQFKKNVKITAGKMNTTKNKNNFLIDVKSNDYLADLYRLCLKKVQKGLLVLIITSKKYDFSPLLRKIKLSKDQMKRLIVINYTTIEDVFRKLFDLHDWTMLPSLVVVDISGLIITDLSPSTTAPIMKSVCLCAASFLDYLHSVSLAKEKQIDDADSSIVNGLFILKTEGENFGASHLKLLQSLYFYETELVDDVEKLPMLLKEGSR